jgi:uncharacterized protein (DUF58 family)
MRALIGESWLLASFSIAAVGLIANSQVLLALAVLLFGTGAVSRLWARVALEEVTYDRTLSSRRAFVGESIGVRLGLRNAKVIPVPWIEVREQVPRDLPIEGARVLPSGIPRVSFITRNTSLGNHERLEWPIELHPDQRGYYRLGPARLRSGDLFGFFERERSVRQIDTIIVYPQTYALAELGFPSARPFGEHRGGNRIFEDPSRVVGVRDYLPGDPLKRIDWNATARTGRLQSRLYEPSRTQATVIALNITTMERSWQGFVPELLERGVSVAASIARHVAEAGDAVGLVANGSFPDADRPIRIGASSHPEQLLHLLEALAVIAPFTTSALAGELESRTHALPVGASVVVVAALMPADLAATLRRLRGEGHNVYVVKTSDIPWEQPLGPIPVQDVEPYMRDLEALRPPAGTEVAP